MSSVMRSRPFTPPSPLPHVNHCVCFHFGPDDSFALVCRTTNLKDYRQSLSTWKPSRPGCRLKDRARWWTCQVDKHLHSGDENFHVICEEDLQVVSSSLLPSSHRFVAFVLHPLLGFLLHRLRGSVRGGGGGRGDGEKNDVK